MGFKVNEITFALLNTETLFIVGINVSAENNLFFRVIDQVARMKGGRRSRRVESRPFWHVRGSFNRIRRPPRDLKTGRVELCEKLVELSLAAIFSPPSQAPACVRWTQQ